MNFVENNIKFSLPIEQPVLKNKISNILKKYNTNNLPIVVVAPGAKRKTNQWNVEKFIKVSQHILNKGYFICLIGGKNEEKITNIIKENFKKNIISLSGQLSILESAFLLKQSKICVCVDSGVQHISAAVGTKVISLFSARDFPGMWYPEGNQNIIIRKTDICSCFLKEYCEGNKCMGLINVDDVTSSFDNAIK